MQSTGSFSPSLSFGPGTASSFTLDFLGFFFFFFFWGGSATSGAPSGSWTSPNPLGEADREDMGCVGVTDVGGVGGRLWATTTSALCSLENMWTCKAR